VGRPDFSLGRRAKITVEIANDGGAKRRSATFADIGFTAFTSLRRRLEIFLHTLELLVEAT
jgi:hypothetical protein